MRVENGLPLTVVASVCESSIKEYYCCQGLSVNTAMRRLHRVRQLVRSGLGLNRHRRIFNKYYKQDVWGGGSGSGSTEENTATYRDFLTKFIRANEVKSVVDLGCGDWQFSRLIDWSGVNYTGLDVSSVVLGNSRRFAGPGVTFLELDGTRQELPQADLLVVKDVLQHWSTKDIQNFLPKLQGFKFALLTNGADERGLNSSIDSGQCRPIDLSLPPFNVPGVTVLRYQADEPKAVFLWRRES